MNRSLLDHYFTKTPSSQRQSEVIAYLAALDHLSQKAPSIAEAILKEIEDQRTHLKLIASENFSSLSVQLAMGNLLTDKYSEGYPHHRFYAGCENVDTIEAEAVELAKKLFGVDHAYVQPHSGADANLVAFWAILTARVQNPHLQALGKKNLDELSEQEFEELRQLLCNQKFMGLSLGSGGHLTHGFRQNVSAKMMRAIPYDVDPKTGQLDYKQILTLAKKEKPLVLLAGYSAYPRRINFAKMREIADETGAVLMVDMAHFAGLVAGKVFKGEENPVGYAQVLTTTTHKTLRGPRGGIVLCDQEFATAVDKGCPLVLGGPLPHVMAAKAIALKEASSPDFAIYAEQIVKNARALAEGLKKRGLDLVTGGTDNHLILIDLTSLNMTGRVAEIALGKGGVTANRNTISSRDPNGAWYTSGIRLGTPSVTTLGMGEKEMEEIADIIVQILQNTQPKSLSKAETKQEILEAAKQRVHALLNTFPLYPQLLIT
ncbi:MAG: glycine hydroxymethyltransferase [Chlamydiales bacterium]